MSKQFEYEPWRAVRDAKGRIMHYTNGFTGLGDDYVDDLVIETTHLTDAECAAELWSAAYQGLNVRIARGGWEPRSVEWHEVWHRFATHPHAHEDE